MCRHSLCIYITADAITLVSSTSTRYRTQDLSSPSFRFRPRCPPQAGGSGSHPLHPPNASSFKSGVHRGWAGSQGQAPGMQRAEVRRGASVSCRAGCRGELLGSQLQGRVRALRVQGLGGCPPPTRPGAGRGVCGKDRWEGCSLEGSLCEDRPPKACEGIKRPPRGTCQTSQGRLRPGQGVKTKTAHAGRGDTHPLKMKQ